MLQKSIENHKGNEENGIRMDSVKAQIAQTKPKICFWVIKEGPKCPLSTATTRKPICGDQLSVRSPLLKKNDIGWTGSNFPKITLTVLKRNCTFCGVMKENSSFWIQGPLTVCLNQTTGYCEGSCCIIPKRKCHQNEHFKSTMTPNTPGREQHLGSR